MSTNNEQREDIIVYFFNQNFIVVEYFSKYEYIKVYT